MLHAPGADQARSATSPRSTASTSTLRRGEAFGFLGPNGAGKSSTMRMVGCVSPVTAGELQIFGLDPATRRPAIRARLGVVPAAGQPRRGAHRRGEPVDLRAVLRPHPPRGPRARRRAARVRPAHRAAPRPGRAAVRRDEASADHRPSAHQQPRAAPARRADDRARPAGPARALGPALPAQARRASRLSSRRTTWTRPSSCATGSSSWTEGRIVAEGSPRALIASTPPARSLELRFDADDHAPPRGPGERHRRPQLEVLPDRLLALRRRR